VTDVTLLPVRVLPAVAGVRVVVRDDVVERVGVAVVRSAEAGAWLRATLGDRKVGEGAA
jgi:hypothetical protein